MFGWKGVAALTFALLAFAGGPIAHVGSARPPVPRALDPDVTENRHARLLEQLRPDTADLNPDGNVTFLAARPGRAFETRSVRGRPVASARSFLSSYGDLFTVAGGRELDVRAVMRAPHGATVRFQQRVRGVPVLGGELTIHVDRSGDVSAVNGETLDDYNGDARPTVTAEAAARAATIDVSKRTHVRAGRLTTTAPELWLHAPHLIGPDEDAAPRLVWKMEVTSRARTLAETVLVDAERGSVALRWSEHEAAVDRGVCDAASSPSSIPCAAPFARAEGTAATGAADVDAAYDNMGAAARFFQDTLGRNGIDGAGMPLRATVRYCAPDECPYENAYWDGDQFVFGEGWALADDIVAHELTHGVTDYTSQLFYYYQSGAINESLSDTFGELADLTNGLGNDAPAVRWLIGEDLSFGTLRDMDDPAVYGEPDRMTSPRYASNANDYGGVHTNSGVGNKTAVLVVDGGTFNGQTIRGLGIDKAARIYYEVATRWLTSGSDYEALYYALPGACDSLVGVHGIVADDCAQVRKAVTATELNMQPVTGAAAPEAPVCPSGQTRRDLFFDDMEGDPRANWTSGKIASYNAWYVPQQPYPGSFDPTYATSGTHNIYGDDYLPSSDSFAATTRAVTVPANAYLRFDHAYGFEGDGTNNYDGGVVELSVDGGATWTDAGPLFDSGGYNGVVTAPGNALAGRGAFVDDSHGYHSSRVSLATLAGRALKFRFRLSTDDSGYGYGWYIDDVRLYECRGSAPPSPAPSSSTPAPSETPSPTSAAPVPVVVPPVPPLPTPSLPAPIQSPSVPVPSPSLPMDEADGVPPSNPTATSPSHRTGAWSSDATVEMSLGEARDPSGIDGISWDWSHDGNGGPDDVVDSRTVTSVTSAPLEDGSWYFRLRTVDGAGNWSSPLSVGPYWIDTTSPSPAVFGEERPAFARGMSTTIGWGPATDSSSGLAGYTVESDAASYDSAAMSPLRGAGLLDPSVVSAQLEARPGYTYCYRVVATDGAGNKAPGSTQCTAYPIDDADLVEVRPAWWADVDKPSAFSDERGTRATTRGAVLRRPGIAQARRLALLVATCRVCGRVRVSWNGTPLAPVGSKARAIDLHARRAGTRLVLFRPFTAAQDGTAEIETLSDGPVTVLGLGVSKV